MEDDCFAARLASKLSRRFGSRARELATRRLARAVHRNEIIKADLYLAVAVVLRDERSVYSRSRSRA